MRSCAPRWFGNEDGGWKIEDGAGANDREARPPHRGRRGVVSRVRDSRSVRIAKPQATAAPPRVTFVVSPPRHPPPSILHPRFSSLLHFFDLHRAPLLRADHCGFQHLLGFEGV